jgi:putative toxin-antitoxin system antitoxin component (TIGR02293 family)
MMAKTAAAIMENMLQGVVSFKPAPNQGYDYDMELVAAVQKGLPAAIVSRAAETFELPASVINSIVSRRTLERRIKDKTRLTPEESDRLIRVVRIMARAIETFGDQKVAIEWMNAPNRAMEGRTPLSIINTDPGIAVVQRILGRIEHGIFS